MNQILNEYHQQAEDFLKKFWMEYKCVLKNKKKPIWEKNAPEMSFPPHPHYEVTLTKLPGKERLKFDFWGSTNDWKEGKQTLPAYDVLANISNDIHCPEKFEDFCDEFGYGRDSMSANKTFKKVKALSKKLNKFFNQQEIEDLQEIR